MRAVARAVAVAFVVAGCDVLPDWFGQAEAPPLPGERISVLSLETTPEADPRISDLRVRLPRPVANAEWPQAGGYPHHAMHHIEVPGSLALSWTADIGTAASSDRRLLAAPIVAARRVFTLDASGRLSAFEAETGRRLWRVNVASKVDGGDAFGGGLAYGRARLYVATGDGRVTGFDLRSGERLWRISLGAPIRAAPTLSDGRLFVVTYDNQLFAVDAASGETLWTHAGIAESAQLLGAPSPAVASGLVIAAYSSGEVFALRVDSGRVEWNDTLTFGMRTGPASTLGDINGSPVIDRDRVYVASHAGRLAAIELRTGERIWEQEISSIQTPWIAGDFLYVLTTEGDVLCLSRRDGRIRWVRPLPRYEDPADRDGPIFWNGPILVSDRLIVVGSHGTALSISPYTGEVLGRLELRDGVEVPPVVADGTVYMLTNDAELIALR